MWRSLEAVSLATPEAFDQNPSLVWQFYHYRREAALRAQPNAAHLALAKMMVPSILARVAPAAQSFHLITQNVDGLSTRAIQAVAEERRSALSSPSPQDLPNPSCLIEMHGRLFDVRCTQCNHTVLDFSSPLCSALHEADKEHTSVIQAGQKEHEVKIPVSELPKCSECGSLARPGVVWFGEEIPLLEDIDKIVAEADLCLVVGTSSRVSIPVLGSILILASRFPQPPTLQWKFVQTIIGQAALPSSISRVHRGALWTLDLLGNVKLNSQKPSASRM